jgi:hypothetical protein
MTTPAPEQPKPDPKPKKEKKPGRWRRRIIMALAIFVCLVVLCRALLRTMLGIVMNKVAHTYNLQVDYDRMDVHLINGNAAIWNFRVLPIEGGKPILQADFLQGDISTIGLLKGRLVVYRAAADGVDCAVEREADGSIPLLKRFASNARAAAPATRPAASPTTAPSLEPPLRVDALRLEHIRARFRDLSVEPNVDTQVALNLRLSHLGITGEPAHFEIEMSSDPILDTLRVDGDSTTDPTQLNATLNVVMRGLHLKPVRGYLVAFGIQPTADDISARMTGNLAATLVQNPHEEVNAILKLDNGRLTADGAEAAAMDHMTAKIDSLTSGSAKITEVDLDGVRANASRSSKGTLAMAGVELVPPTTQPGTTTEPARVEQPPPTPEPQTATAPFHVTLGSFYLSGLHAGFVDQFVSPPVTLALESKQIQITNLQSNDKRDIKVDLAAPGLVKDIALTGQANVLSATKSVAIDIKASGIDPMAIKPYLDAAGLTSEWHDGTLALRANAEVTPSDSGKITADAQMNNLHLVNDGKDLLAFNDAMLKNASVDPQSSSVSIDSFQANGPGVWAHRDGEGNLHVLGFKVTKKGPTQSATARTEPAATQPALPAETKTASASSALPFDNFELGQFRWEGMQLRLRDDAVSPPADVAVGLLISAEKIAFHRNSKDGAPQTGKFSIHFVPTSDSLIALDGNLTPSAQRTTCDFQVHGQNLNADKFAAYLKPMGVQPALKNGSLECEGKALVDTSGNRPVVSLSVSGLKYADESQTLASLGSLAVDNLTQTDGGVWLDQFTVESPHAVVMRTADGIVQAGGFRFVPTTQPAAADPPPLPPPHPPEASTPPASTFTAGLKTLKVSDAAIDWIDQEKKVSTTLGVNADLSDFSFAPDAKPAPFNVSATVKGAIDSLTATGALLATPDVQSADVAVAATGMRPGPGIAYFPPNIRAKIQNGTFRSTVAARASKNSQGGQAVDVTVKDVDYRDATDSAPLFSFDTFHMGAPRLDISANVIAIDDLSLSGLQTNVRKTAKGTDLLGLELASDVNPPAQPSPAAATTEKSATDNSTPAPVAKSATTEPASEQEVLHQVAAERAKLPMITLRNLDVKGSKLSYTDETKPNSKPISIIDLRVHNPKPISLLGSDPEANPPTEVTVTGKIDPIAENFTVVTKASPFARQKTLNVDLSVSGVHGQGLVDIEPDLASKIDGSQLENGQLGATLVASLTLQTVRSTDFDLSHGGKLDFSLTNLAFRSNPGGPVLAGVGEIRSDGVVLSPNIAGVEVRELEIDKIAGQGVRKADGIHACGLIIKMPTTQPATTNPSVIKASVGPPDAKIAPAPPAAPESEYKIDRLLVSGIDFRVEDQTCTPPAIIPIESLDLEAQNLSSLAITRDETMRFDMVASAGKVELPQSGKSPPAKREVFSQVTASGVVALYPELKGWAKASINGFELMSVSGIAAQEKVNLGGGTLDCDVDARFPGDGSIDTSNRIVFTDLKISEPENGPISQTLKLNVPLDFAIAALQDQDGSITIPVNVPIKQGEVNKGAIISSGVGALAQVIATAIASSPLKLAGALGLSSKPAAQPPVSMAFPPGYAELGPDEMAQLEALVNRLLKEKNLEATIRSDAGKADVALAAERMNPGPDDALILATALSKRLEALRVARSDAAGQVRAVLGSNATEDTAQAIERLRAIDRQIADTESATDQAYDLLRPGADRQADRRTRAATLAVARARLEAVQKFMESSGKSPISKDRIHTTNPQFNESPDAQHGTVTVTVVKAK